jgi:hypothetical protein
MDAAERQPLTHEHKDHLLGFLKILKDHKHARLFLDQEHLDSLGLPRYPEIIKPILELGTIERKLRENQYHAIEDLIDDFKCMVGNAYQQWGASHDITQAGKKLLFAVEAVMGCPSSTGLALEEIIPEELQHSSPQPTATQHEQSLNSEQVELLDTKIAQIEIMHTKDIWRPRDNLQPMHELRKVRREIMSSNSQSAREIWHRVESLHSRSESTNGSQHRVTLLISEALDLVESFLEEATPDARILDLEGLSGEQMRDSPEPSPAPNAPPLRRKERYIQQRQEEYRAGKRTDRKITPRNLVADKILERTTKIAANGGKASDEFEDEVEDEFEADAEEEDEVTETQHSLKDNTKGYTDSLRDLPKDMPTMEQSRELGKAKLLGPNFLGRTASLTSGQTFGNSRKTNGSTSQDLLLPAADTNEEYDQHAALEDLSQGEIIYMTGHHLAWADLRGDELLSYSTDMLFLVVHALGRANRGQGGVTIQFLDRRKVRTTDGVRARFYHALDLYTIFEVPRWPGWRWKNKLHPRKFTHEYLSHGTLRCHDSTLKQADLNDLIHDGLYEIFPPLQTPESHKRVPLYRLQVIYRRIGYPPRFPRIGEVNPLIYSYEDCAEPRAMTIELLQTVRRVSLNFRHREEGSSTVKTEPPLHAFIGFLTFEKRQRADPVFTQWIQQHYTRKSYAFLLIFGHRANYITTQAKTFLTSTPMATRK